jgi:hypothetical protein
MYHLLILKLLSDIP